PTEFHDPASAIAFAPRTTPSIRRREIASSIMSHPHLPKGRGPEADESRSGPPVRSRGEIARCGLTLPSRPSGIAGGPRPCAARSPCRQGCLRGTMGAHSAAALSPSRFLTRSSPSPAKPHLGPGFPSPPPPYDPATESREARSPQQHSCKVLVPKTSPAT